MTIKTTRWRPDTCGCELEYNWDDSQPEASRSHNLNQVSIICSAHAVLASNTIRWNTILEENPRKNAALDIALANGPTGLYDTIDGTRQLKPTITYNYSWSGTAPNRVLTISFTGISLTSTQKTTIRNALNTRFGTGKVLIP